MGPSSGPDVPIFKRFQNDWSKLDQKNFVPGILDEKVAEHIGNEERLKIVAFAKEQLKVSIFFQKFSATVFLSLLSLQKLSLQIL